MTPNQAWQAGHDAPKGSRCPFKSDDLLAKEWTKGRNSARRAARMDLRPSFRKSGKRFERYTPSHILRSE